MWRRSASEYVKGENFYISEADFIPLYTKLYKQVGGNEAKIAIKSMPSEKDFFDAIANFFTGNNQETITFVRELMGSYFEVSVMTRLAEVTETTRRQIQSVIQQGFDEGLGARERAQLIREKAPEINKVRSIRIARTESVTASNKAQLLTHEASPFVYEKAWLSVHDKRTRISHLQMDKGRFIPLSQPFLVANSGGFLEELMIPGDVSGSASNVINCRCTCLYKAKRGEDGRLIRKVK